MKLTFLAIFFVLLSCAASVESIMEEEASNELDSNRVFGDILETIDELEFERHPRNMKRFTNKWQQIGPIWG